VGGKFFGGERVVVVSSSLGFRDEYDFFLLTVSTMSSIERVGKILVALP
jgi:hypothetical protein